MAHSLPDTGKFLHVGCGPKRAGQTPFAGLGWQEIRLDIDPQAVPDVLGSMVDMGDLDNACVDALFSSHNIQHLYPHEVPLALAEFKRVLKPSGFVLITCPDLRSVAALVANDQLTDAAYVSPAGPVAAIDILYGHRPAMRAGNLFMAHRCGFTEKVLVGTLQEAGFQRIASRTRAESFDLWALATVEDWSDDGLLTAASRLMPGVLS